MTHPSVSTCLYAISQFLCMHNIHLLQLRLSPAYFSICLVTLFRMVVSALKIVFASCGMEPIKSLEPLLNLLNIYGYANLVLRRSLLVYCVAAYIHEDGSIKSSKAYIQTPRDYRLLMRGVCYSAIRIRFRTVKQS